jgi:hypothetical protein
MRESKSTKGTWFQVALAPLTAICKVDNLSSFRSGLEFNFDKNKRIVFREQQFSVENAIVFRITFECTALNRFWCEMSQVKRRCRNGAPPLAMPRQWRTVLKDKQAEKIP